MLTTFTLPAKYDDLPVMARLWLQSRVDEGPAPDEGPGGDSKATAKPSTTDGVSKPAKAGELAPNGSGTTTPVAAPKLANGRFLPPNHYRPMSIANTKVSLDMTRRLIPLIKLLLRPQYRHLLPKVALAIIPQVFSGLGDAAR